MKFKVHFLCPKRQAGNAVTCLRNANGDRIIQTEGAVALIPIVIVENNVALECLTSRVFLLGSKLQVLYLENSNIFLMHHNRLDFITVSYILP